MIGASVLIEHGGPVVTLTLNRPDQRNALTPEMLEALIEAATSLPPAARCLVLAGEGRAFCAGFDLALCHAHPEGSAMRALLTGLSRAITALRGLPVPVVVAAHGAAIAGGCALLGGADLVVADRAAKFGYPVVRLGVSPAVSAPFLAAAIGHGRARERLLDPAIIDGAEALRAGLVHELVDSPDAVRPRARQIADSLADKPRAALAATRAWLAELDSADVHAHRALAASLSLTGSTEEQAGLAAARRK